MNRRLAVGFAGLIACVGALTVACSGSSPDDGSERTTDAVRKDDPLGGGGDPPVVHHDAGRADTSPVLAPVVPTPVTPAPVVVPPLWARDTCANDRYVVRRRTVAEGCSAVAPSWHGTRVFPQLATSTQCLYEWQGASSPTVADYNNLDAIAAIRPKRPFRAEIIQDCTPTATNACMTATNQCAQGAAADATCNPDAGVQCTGGGDGGPICESCATVSDGLLEVVLSDPSARDTSKWFVHPTLPGAPKTRSFAFTPPAGQTVFTVAIPTDALADHMVQEGDVITLDTFLF